jgi:hypothetical protein
MEKVVSSSLIIRSQKCPGNGLFFAVRRQTSGRSRRYERSHVIDRQPERLRSSAEAALDGEDVQFALFRRD